ncbi:MAG: o-succinylbenzoate synthase [Chlorobium sp.]|nr:o-succinylbenzoate synthase [Chlorobium sp.]
MKPQNASIYRYSIPFVRPVPVLGKSLDTRDGFVLALKSGDGLHTGFGEIAPLPGLHKESLPEALEQCGTLLLSPRLSYGGLSLEDAGKHLPDSISPSVRAGFEMALLNLQSAASGALPSFPGAPEAARKLPLNALLFGDAPSVISMAKDYFRNGYRTFKLKVQASNPGLAVKQVLALRSAFGGEISLRLDSNRSFDLEKACLFFNRIPADSIEYIEEPLADPFLIPEFFSRTGIRSALDESLWMSPGIWNGITRDCLGGVVLKPARLGSFATTLRLAREARDAGIAAVISAAFESGIALGFYAHLASVLSKNPSPCGLDTFRQLSRDILYNPLHAESGCLDTATAYRNSLNPDLSRLKLIEAWTL